jgi:hypothetical protein
MLRASTLKRTLTDLTRSVFKLRIPLVNSMPVNTRILTILYIIMNFDMEDVSQVTLYHRPRKESVNTQDLVLKNPVRGAADVLDIKLVHEIFRSDDEEKKTAQDQNSRNASSKSRHFYQHS